MKKLVECRLLSYLLSSLFFTVQSFIISHYFFSLLQKIERFIVELLITKLLCYLMCRNMHTQMVLLYNHSKVLENLKSA